MRKPRLDLIPYETRIPRTPDAVAPRFRRLAGLRSAFLTRIFRSSRSRRREEADPHRRASCPPRYLGGYGVCWFQAACKISVRLGCVWLCLILGSLPLEYRVRAVEVEPDSARRYETRAEHDRDGIGKFYMGREIAHVMGHQAADWLERPERDEEEKPDLLIQALKLKPGDAVADIGAGTGYISWRMARAVGAKGRVYAVDIQQEMLDLLAKSMSDRKISNTVPVLGTISGAKLPPNSIDLAIMVDVYHEFSHPYEMTESICRALKPGGRLVFVEYRLEDPAVPIKRLHRMSVAQVRKEMEVMPLDWTETIAILPRQHIIIFRKQGS